MSASSHKEIEARWLNLDPDDIRARLAKIGAVKTGSYFFREWIFTKPEWKPLNKRIRIRTDGQKSWATIKTNETFTIDSTHEVEVEVSDPERAVDFIKATGLPLVRHQEKKRETYEKDGVSFDLDFWPKIPMVFEIEAESEEKVRQAAASLGLEWKDAVFVDQAYVHRDHYGIDIFNISDYRFER
jgi:adenylate cyclase class IV